MPPAAIASSVRRVISSSPRRRRNSRTGAGGNFGARPKPPHVGSNTARRFSCAASSRSAVSGSLDAASSEPERMCSARFALERAHLVAARLPRLGHGEQHLRERGQTVSRLGREVGAAEERLAFGRQEHGHRPAAAARQRDDRVHVDRVEVRALLAVDLDADEALVHHARRRRVLERLALHHVAPVAGRVADREQDRAVLEPRTRQRLVAPRVPVDGVRRVLEQVRRRLVRETVHRRRSRLPPSTASVSAPAMPNATMQRDPGVVLEEPSAEVAEHRRVDRPRERSERIERGEPRVREVRDAARERRRGSAARHVAGDDEEEPAAFFELPARPRECALCALAGQEALLERPADEPPDARTRCRRRSTRRAPPPRSPTRASGRRRRRAARR